jgi:methionyl-tRNA formyltransferase
MRSGMKAIVFAYHNMGVTGITKLLDHGFSIPLVFTHDDNPDENVWFGSVKALCREKGIPFVTPTSPNTPEWISEILGLKPDYIFSFYYRYMISGDILSIPGYGAYNLHGSLLPKYRGRCPVNWVIINGETETGVTLHEMEVKPDAGAIIAQRRVEIAFDDTAHSLFGKLQNEAALMLDECLPDMAGGVVKKTPQDLSKGSYFGGRKPEDGRINWNAEAVQIYNLVRGVTRPYPGAYSMLGEEKVIFWKASILENAVSEHGRIENGETVFIGSGKDAIIPIEIEVEGKTLAGDDLHRFFKNHEGEKLT